MENEQHLISRWLDLAGYQEGNIPKFPEGANFQLALSLILEELIEAGESASREQYELFLNTSKAVIEKKLANITNEKKEGDVDELRDACADLRVVMGNLIHFAGLKDKYTEDFHDVMESNFTKYCTNEEDAKETVRLYAIGEHPNKMGSKIECIYESVDEYFIIKNKDTGKILKSLHYQEPKFRQK